MHSLARPQHTPFLPSQLWARWLLCLILFALLAACGFRLKGVSPLPFNTIYTNIEENSAFGAQVRRAITASSPNTRFVSDPTQAQARLTQLANTQSLREVSISAQGQVEEYELNLDFTFQLTDDKGHLVLPPTTLQTSREIPYDSGALQAKQGEIGSLFIEMQQSLVDRMVRRLTSPEVLKAFENTENLPIDARPETTEPLNPDERTRTPMPFKTPGISPGTGLY